MGQSAFDVVVVGAGTMGSMVLWRLARRGVSALGLERFAPGHDHGSGHGESRMIRTAYFEGPQYVPLVRAAFPLWRELEAEAGVELLAMTGALMIGRPDGELVSGALQSARRHGLACSLLGPAEVAARFPQHRLAAGEVALWEEAAGVLRPELAIRAAAGRAVALGARLVTGERVSAVSPGGDGSVTVRAADVEYRARHVVVCAGPWLPGLLPSLGLALAVERQVMSWFPVRDAALFAPVRFPPFIRERAGPFGYGLPSLDGATVKVAFHHGGRETDPETVDRSVTEEELSPVASFVAETLPDLVPRAARAAVCLYTNTADEHFVVGPAPGLPGVTLLGGFSGHGFKFAPVLGEIAADLALTGSTAHSIEGFDPGRLAARPGAPAPEATP